MFERPIHQTEKDSLMIEHDGFYLLSIPLLIIVLSRHTKFEATSRWR